MSLLHVQQVNHNENNISHLKHSNINCSINDYIATLPSCVCLFFYSEHGIKFTKDDAHNLKMRSSWTLIPIPST